MFKRFRDRRRQIRFDHTFIKVAEEQFEEGTISYDALQKCHKAADNPKVMREAREEIMNNPLLGGIKDWDWDSIYEWFVTYFIPAMRIIIPMIMLLDDE